MAYTNLPSYSAQTANYTLSGFEDLVEFNATSGNLVATMCSAAAVAVGKLFTLKKTDASQNTVTANQTVYAVAQIETLTSGGTLYTSITAERAW
jgi:Leucine-rich repeat (LRR) protein